MQGLDHQRAARGEQGIHRAEQGDDVLMQQGKVGADQVIIVAEIHTAFDQGVVAGQMNRPSTAQSCGFDQRRLTVNAHRRDSPFSQCSQQPALAAAKVEHALGLTSEDR
ncbi:hypothetical protein D3C77_539140 [compost metagenome]